MKGEIPVDEKSRFELISQSKAARTEAEKELVFKVPEPVFQRVFWYSLNKISRYPKSYNIGFDYLPYLLRTELIDHFVAEEINLRSEALRMIRKGGKCSVFNMQNESVSPSMSKRSRTACGLPVRALQ